MDKWLNKIICGDCLEVMKELPDKSVDLVLTDPPYKMNHSTGGCTNIGFENKWQGMIKAGNTVMDFDTDINFSEWVGEMYRVLKNDTHAYIFINDKNLYELLGECQKVGFQLSNILVWHKNNCTPNRYYMKNGEFILFLRKGKAVPINNMGTKAVLDINNINGKDKLHPTEKPIELLEILIKNSSLSNDIILDPFLGSGTTAVASLNTGRFFVGIEKEPKYCEIARKRLEQAQMQQSLFAEA